MKMKWRFLLVPAALLLLCGSARAQSQTGTNSQQLHCSGTVTDASGNPLAGATVEYWQYTASQLELRGQVTTENSGAFDFEASRTTGFLLARKTGLASAWRTLDRGGYAANTPERLVLTPPETLSGVVVDEANQPITNAEVFATIAVYETLVESGDREMNHLNGKPARDSFTARTDGTGHFRIGNLPTNATAALAVRAPGKALRQTAEYTGFDSLPWRAGDRDIKLVVEPAGGIEGRVVVAGGNPSLPVAWLSVQPERSGYFGELGQVQSGADGGFLLTNLAAGSYSIQARFGTNGDSGWIAESFPVSVEAGAITRGAQVTATHGGLLEVAVLGKNDHKPLLGVTVIAYKSGFQAAGKSDSKGIALLRLPPGDYQIQASSESTASSQTSGSAEAGTTNRIEVEIAPPQKITGIVRQPDGKPAGGLQVRIVGVFGNPNSADVKTDAGGKFEFDWNSRQVSQNNETACILVRDVERNLAVAQDIEEDSSPMDLKLAPGLTLAGRVECDGKPVTNVAAALIFWTGRSGMHLYGLARGTNSPGQFEIPALPPGRKYGVMVSAPGYGQKPNYDVGASADTGRMDLDVFELKPANLKLAGQVLDADDKPASGVYVNLSGDSQAFANVRTDRDGRFQFNQVCEGQVRLSANRNNSYGNASAEGGDTNVVLRLGQTYASSSDSTTHKLKGTVMAPDGKPAAGAQLAVFPNNGLRWTKTGAGGTFSLNWALESWQSQNGGALLVVRDTSRNLAVTVELHEDVTNLDVKLSAATTITGLVKKADDTPLAGAQVGLWLKAGNSYDTLNEQMAVSDAEGRYAIKCLPPDAHYLVYASAKGYGRSQQQVQGDAETNRMELLPFVLKLADRVLAGQVLNENDKPVSGINVSLNGDDQPEASARTDSKGRFRFQVCEGTARVYANGDNSYGQVSAESGDTNVVLTLSSQSRSIRESPSRASLKGSPLPDLGTMNLAADAVAASKSLLLCLFDAGQRPSRHVVSQLNERTDALRQQGIHVLGIQAALISDDTFNDWKSASQVTLPVGRITEKSEKSKWASTVPALPWLILTGADHRVIAEGFAFDELDAQLQKLPK